MSLSIKAFNWIIKHTFIYLYESISEVINSHKENKPRVDDSTLSQQQSIVTRL